MIESRAPPQRVSGSVSLERFGVLKRGRNAHILSTGLRTYCGTVAEHELEAIAPGMKICERCERAPERKKALQKRLREMPRHERLAMSDDPRDKAAAAVL